MIHPTAIVNPGAKIGVETEIGPYSIIGDHVVIDSHVKVDGHVVVQGPTHIGGGTRIFPFASIGESPQDLKFEGELTELQVGRRNIIRECVTMNRGTAGGGGMTSVGDGN